MGIITPVLNRTVVNEIIQPGYIEKLSPERRFDQTTIFHCKNINFRGGRHFVPPSFILLCCSILFI
ncbi:MAG: HindVP family restriction endonuclease [bacterium]|nr:HindVP family restriction endonuclease [bacterium]